MCFQSKACAIHIALDAWTSPNHHPFMAFVACLAQGGHIEEFLLDFVELSKVHCTHIQTQTLSCLHVYRNIQERIWQYCSRIFYVIMGSRTGYDDMLAPCPNTSCTFSFFHSQQIMPPQMIPLFSGFSSIATFWGNPIRYNALHTSSTSVLMQH